MNTSLADGVFGHDRAIHLLSQAIALHQVPQSLLVTGIPQVGKATLAYTFAMALNCHQQNPPCRDCPSCRKMLNRSHPDLTIFDAPQETLKIEQIRALQRDLSLKPHEGTYKVAVFCDFERATQAAANALLKTLEEPPAHAVLILTAQNATHLLPTIVSRCQIVHLRPIADRVIEHVLQTHWEASGPKASLLSRLSSGRLGWAVTALTDSDMLPRREQYLADLVEILSKGEAFRLAYAYSFGQSRQPLAELLNLWLSWWRDVLLVKNDSPEQIVNIDLMEMISWAATNLLTSQIIAIIKQTFSALGNLNYNVNLRLNLEVLLLNLPTLPVYPSKV